MNDNFLEKMADSFDDFKERLIRIEENIKGFSSVKDDLDQTKIKLAQTMESTKSAHKRMDSLEKTSDDREKELKWMKRQIVIGGITFFTSVLAGIVIYVLTIKK